MKSFSDQVEAHFEALLEAEMVRFPSNGLKMSPDLFRELVKKTVILALIKDKTPEQIGAVISGTAMILQQYELKPVVMDFSEWDIYQSGEILTDHEKQLLLDEIGFMLLDIAEQLKDLDSFGASSPNGEEYIFRRKTKH
jgi:hypothetical protein